MRENRTQPYLTHPEVKLSYTGGIKNIRLSALYYGERVYLSIDNDTNVKFTRLNDGVIRENPLIKIIS